MTSEAAGLRLSFTQEAAKFRRTPNLTTRTRTTLSPPNPQRQAFKMRKPLAGAGLVFLADARRSRGSGLEALQS